MKILFWSEKYLPDIGGVEVFGASLMGKLSQRGYKFAVVTCRSYASQPGHEIIDDVDVYRFDFHKPLYSKDLAGVTSLSDEVADLKRQIEPDLIHLNTTQPSIFYHVHTSRAYDCPSMVTIHSPPTFVEGPHSLYGRLVRDAVRITAVSDATRQALIDAVPDVDPKTFTIYNGLEPPTTTPAPLHFDPVHVVCAGRLVEEKGFDVALKAFHLLLQTSPTAHMSIAGDGPERSSLEALAAQLNIDQSVHFTGWVPPDQVCDFMISGSMVVVPSRWQEPFGLVALQGSQVGRPVIVSDVGGLPEVVTHDTTGLVVRPEDPDALAGAMSKLAKEHALARQFGQEGRKRALEEFTLDRCADDYHDVFHQVLTETATAEP